MRLEWVGDMAPCAYEMSGRGMIYGEVPYTRLSVPNCCNLIVHYHI